MIRKKMKIRRGERFNRSIARAFANTGRQPDLSIEANVFSNCLRRVR